MNINGKAIAEEIKNELRERVQKLPQKPRLDIIYMGTNAVIEGFLRMKQRTGEFLGIETTLHRFPETITQNVLIEEIKKISGEKNCDGIIVQLPLPAALHTGIILSAVPPEKDIDVLSEEALLLFEQGKHFLLPPVIGAIAEILERNKIIITDKNAVVLGNGRLVGRPAAAWFKQQGAKVAVLDKNDGDKTPFLQKADIIVSGTGVPGLIRPEILQQGVLLFDAGASEQSGEIKGDADPSCAEKCAVFTPVPGGIGPITVALLFKNLLNVVEKKA